MCVLYILKGIGLNTCNQTCDQQDFAILEVARNYSWPGYDRSDSMLI